MSKSIVHGFSKLSKSEKIEVLANQLQMPELKEDLQSFWHYENQDVWDTFAENTLSNYYLPFGIAPNFLIDGEIFHVPMVVEESSVVAAASWAAVFWAKLGGFRTRVISTVKTGQIHFTWTGNKELLFDNFTFLQSRLFDESGFLTLKMKERGGGITFIELQDATMQIPYYYRIHLEFETVDSMGANFINSVLEEMALILNDFCTHRFSGEGECEVIMAILSNYTPKCLVEVRVEAPVVAFDYLVDNMSGNDFVRKFNTAVRIASVDISRAVTHNKGIMNGMDAVVIATGNDFRAVEADVHSFAAQSGCYSSLSKATLEKDIFRFSLIVPLAVGTIGGLTSLHPLAKKSLSILGNPNASQLMSIIASVGLANHFAAIKALVSGGIQKGHMKMHLNNILAQLGASEQQKTQAKEWFRERKISFASVRTFIENNTP